jgi:glycosyltransferase involved in cell wall biosynthesis
MKILKKKTGIVCFPHQGGIKQFSDQLYSAILINSEAEVEFVQCKNNFFARLFFFLSNPLYQHFIFTTNNISIYPFIILYWGRVTLILHDHKSRSGSNLRENIALFLFQIFRWRFTKIIIHQSCDVYAKKLLLSNNVRFMNMPPHGHNAKAEVNYFNYKALNNNSINILCFGRIEYYKNFEFLIEVLANVKGFNLKIAGQGKLSNKHLEMINISNNISLLNKFIPDEQVNILFKDCDFLALPYTDITQTGLIDLAGYYGKPVILSNIEQFSDKLFDGYCIRINICDKFKALESLMQLQIVSDDTYKSMCSASYNAHVKSMAGWREYARALI